MKSGQLAQSLQAVPFSRMTHGSGSRVMMCRLCRRHRLGRLSCRRWSCRGRRLRSSRPRQNLSPLYRSSNRVCGCPRRSVHPWGWRCLLRAMCRTNAAVGVGGYACTATAIGQRWAWRCGGSGACPARTGKRAARSRVAPGDDAHAGGHTANCAVRAGYQQLQAHPRSTSPRRSPSTRPRAATRRPWPICSTVGCAA